MLVRDTRPLCALAGLLSIHEVMLQEQEASLKLNDALEVDNIASRVRPEKVPARVVARMRLS